MVCLLLLTNPSVSGSPLGGMGLMLLAGVGWGTYSLRGRRATGPLRTTAANFVRTVPLVLVLWMSLHEWPLIGEPTLNLPANYTGIAHNPLFAGAVAFTLKYTVIVTIVLFGAASGSPCWSSATAAASAVPHRVLPARRRRVRHRVAKVLRPASRDLGPVNAMLEAIGVIDRPIVGERQPDLALGSSIGLRCGASPASTC
jgi:multiple sugar transport system permease protein